MIHLPMLLLLLALPQTPEPEVPARRVTDDELGDAQRALLAGETLTSRQITAIAVGRTERALDSGPLYTAEGEACPDFDSAMVALRRTGLLVRTSPTQETSAAPASDALRAALAAWDAEEDPAEARACLDVVMVLLGLGAPADVLGASWEEVPAEGDRAAEFRVTIHRAEVVIAIGG